MNPRVTQEKENIQIGSDKKISSPGSKKRKTWQKDIRNIMDGL